MTTMDFDDVMIGHPNHLYHLEFTHHRGIAAGRAPTPDNLLVFNMPDKHHWNRACEKMQNASFTHVSSYNPYWDVAGKTFEDLDGYRGVLQNREWGA